jgi:hypothetical protein
LSLEVKLVDRRKELLKNIIMFILIVAVPTSFFIGYDIPKPNREQSATIVTLEKEIQDKQILISKLEKDIIFLEQKDDINQNAEEDTRQTIKMLESQLFDVQQKLKQYINILNKDSNNNILNIDSLEIIPSNIADDGEQKYRFKLFLSNTQKNSVTLDLKIKILIHGTLDGKNETLSLKDFSDISSDVIEDKLSNLLIVPKQNNFLEVSLIDGFEVSSVEVQVMLQKPKQTIKKIFPWITQ